MANTWCEVRGRCGEWVQLMLVFMPGGGGGSLGVLNREVETRMLTHI